MHVTIHSMTTLGIRFWDWEIRSGASLVAAGRVSGRWAAAVDAVERETKRHIVTAP